MNTGVQEYRNTGVQEYRNTGMSKKKLFKFFKNGLKRRY